MNNQVENADPIRKRVRISFLQEGKMIFLTDILIIRQKEKNPKKFHNISFNFIYKY